MKIAEFIRKANTHFNDAEDIDLEIRIRKDHAEPSNSSVNYRLRVSFPVIHDSEGKPLEDEKGNYRTAKPTAYLYGESLDEIAVDAFQVKPKTLDEHLKEL